MPAADGAVVGLNRRTPYEHLLMAGSGPGSGDEQVDGLLGQQTRFVASPQLPVAGYASLWRTLSETTVPASLAGPRAGGLTVGLDLIPAGALHGQRRLQDALGDPARVPQAAVLPVERDDAPL